MICVRSYPEGATRLAQDPLRPVHRRHQWTWCVMHCQRTVLMVVQAALLRGGQEADGTPVQQPPALSVPSPQPPALSPQRAQPSACPALECCCASQARLRLKYSH